MWLEGKDCYDINNFKRIKLFGRINYNGNLVAEKI